MLVEQQKKKVRHLTYTKSGGINDYAVVGGLRPFCTG